VPQAFAQLKTTSSPFDVFSDGKTVYFTDRTGGALYACPTTGCGGSPTQLSGNIADPLLIAADSAAVYVTSYASPRRELITAAVRRSPYRCSYVLSMVGSAVLADQ